MTIMRSSFSKLANDSDDIIAFKCLTLWSMVHGLVGIIRKVHVIGDDLEENYSWAYVGWTYGC